MTQPLCQPILHSIPKTKYMLSLTLMARGFCPPSKIAINQPLRTLFSPNFCITAITIPLASPSHEKKIRKNGDLGLKMTILVTAPLEGKIPRFSDPSQRICKKNIKFEFNIVDNHWERLVLDLGYQFLSF